MFHRTRPVPSPVTFGTTHNRHRPLLQDGGSHTLVGMADEEGDGIEVIQSTDSASKFSVVVTDNEVVLIFLSSTKGRMDFSVEIDGTPHGKVNLLSQHSIARLAGAVGISPKVKDEFKTTMLKVGVVLRDGTYTPAPESQAENEMESFIGEDSTLGAIQPKTIDEFLGSNLLIDRINKILHQSRTSPFVGDDANLMLTFFVIVSCKTASPLNLEMVAVSAAGKTYMVLTARNGVPKSMCMVLAGASREALKYDYDEVDEQGNFIINVDGKCIIILEKDESSAFVRKMKPLMSGDDDELIWKTPMKNDLTGEIETRDFIIRGQPSFITLTTRNPREQEQVTRQLLMTPDTTQGKVKAVVGNSLLAKARPEDFSVHPDLKLLQASMLSLGKYRIRNIFAPLMAEFFPSKSAQHQRDINKVLSIIDSITLIHQKQRPIESDANGDFLLSSVEDNVIGLMFADLVLRASLSGVPDDSWMIFQQMQEMVEAKKSLTIDGMLQWLHINAVNVSKNGLKEKHLPTLEDIGLIEVARRGGGRGGGRKTYRIVKTREAMSSRYALAPLFIEGVRRALPNLMEDFDDILARCDPPNTGRNLAYGEAKILKSLGCSNKDQSRVMRALVLPNYLRPTNTDTMLWDAMKDAKFRDLCFSGKSWLDDGLTDDATEALASRREIESDIQEASRDESLSIDADLWENIAEAHYSDTE